MPNSSGYFTPRREVSFFLCTMWGNGRYGDTAFLTSIVSPLCAALPPAHPSPYPPCPSSRWEGGFGGAWRGLLALVVFCLFPPSSLCIRLFVMEKRRCEITIISFSRSICRGRLAALIGMTEKNLIPAVFHAIVTLSAPAGHLPLKGKAAIREYHLLKKGGEAATRTLNSEPNESKVKRGCEEMRIHFFTAPFLVPYSAAINIGYSGWSPSYISKVTSG